MTKDDRTNNRKISSSNHGTDNLFTEWPAPSDTVGGFGGDANKVSDKQWKKEDARNKQ